MIGRPDPPSHELCGCEKLGYFCSLPGPHISLLNQTRVVRNYRRGDIVFREGEPADAIHCIRRGSVKLYKLGSDGEEIVIRFLGLGEIMGYRPMLANEPFAASAVALEDSTVCRISRATTMRVLTETPSLALNLLGKLASELRVSEDQMVQRAVESVPQRTARFLLWLHETRARAFGGTRFDSVLRREDMAMAIGTTPETLSRTLHDFERRRIIELDRRSIRVREPDALRRLAREGPPE